MAFLLRCYSTVIRNTALWVAPGWLISFIVCSRPWLHHKIVILFVGRVMLSAFLSYIAFILFLFFAGKAKFSLCGGNKKWNILNCRTRIKNELWLSRGVTCHATTTIANNQQKILQSRDFYLWYYLSCCLRCWNWMCKVSRIDVVLCYMTILWKKLRYL